MRSRRVALLPLVALVLATCQDQPTSPPLLAISDAAHGGPNAHFYFLPPLVPAPDYGGNFDGMLSPVVDICLLDGTSIATFDMTTGVGSETVRVVDEHYIVNWHTDEFPLINEQMYRINVSVDGTDLGYADVVIGANGREAKNLATEETFGLKDGRTLPIKFRIEDGAIVQPTQPSIDPAFGPVLTQFTVTDPDGRMIIADRVIITPDGDAPDEGFVVSEVSFSADGRTVTGRVPVTMASGLFYVTVHAGDPNANPPLFNGLAFEVQ